MSSTTNFATGTAQGAAVAPTYNVGAIIETLNPQITGVIVSKVDAEFYGVLLYNSTDGSESYSYTIRHQDDLAWTSVSPRLKMKLKIASMVIRKPLPDVDYIIFDCKEGA